jgi:hypothetical protein
MTNPLMYPGFDGLMTLSKREGVDIRPTLLRVLTDLYVQAMTHTADEDRQFVELASRLIDQVDDATRAAVRARLAIYPHAPAAIMQRLALRATTPKVDVKAASQSTPPAAATGNSATAASPPRVEAPPIAPSMALQPKDASELSDMFFAAKSSERAQILLNLAQTPLQPSARISEARAARAMHILEMAAFAEDRANFARELGEALLLPHTMAERVVNDPGGEPLACTAKALGMSSPIFQRVLMFLNPEFGSSVHNVYRLSRLYDILSERSALIMVAAWRGAIVAATRAKYRPTMYDDERHRARATPAQTRPTAQPAMDITRMRNNGK